MLPVAPWDGSRSTRVATYPRAEQSEPTAAVTRPGPAGVTRVPIFDAFSVFATRRRPGNQCHAGQHHRDAGWCQRYQRERHCAPPSATQPRLAAPQRWQAGLRRRARQRSPHIAGVDRAANKRTGQITSCQRENKISPVAQKA